MLVIAALAMAAIQADKPPPQVSPTATATGIDAENEPRIRTAAQLIRDRQPQSALDVATAAVASYNAAWAGEKKRIYCGMSVAETILYGGMAAKDKVDAVMVGPGYCTAIYLRGYALVDLGRLTEARAAYERIVALAPEHAHFLTELGQLSRLEKNWSVMLDTCRRSYAIAGLGGREFEKKEQGFSLRCQGYALTEEHRYDDAERRYREALTLDPADEVAQHELDYIMQQRAKK